MSEPSEALVWIAAGRRFEPAELLHLQGGLFDEAAATRIDTLVLGPHASAAFPAELQPFVNPALTRRQQHDFSDCLTGPLGRAWAAADPRVLFIENPHARLALDANRAPPTDTAHAMAMLRECFERLRRQQAGEALSLAGVDAIRPITFNDEPVLLEPRTPVQWQALAQAYASSISQGVAVYRSACETALQRLMAARAGRPLRLISLHDTMGTKMGADGALVVARPVAAQMPAWVNFGNRGDARGDYAGGDEPVTLDGATLRRLQAAWAQALGVAPDLMDSQLSLNRPYKGAFETTHYGRLLRSHQGPHSGALQVELLRERLLGPAATARLQQSGADWPPLDQALIQGLAQQLARAGQLLREGDA